MMGTFCGVTSATPATTTSAPIPRRGLGSTRSRREAGSPLQRSLSASASQDVGECVVGIVKDITMSTRGNEHLGRDKRIDDEKVRDRSRFGEATRMFERRFETRTFFS